MGHMRVYYHSRVHKGKPFVTVLELLERRFSGELVLQDYDCTEAVKMSNSFKTQFNKALLNRLFDPHHLCFLQLPGNNQELLCNVFVDKLEICPNQTS